MNAARPPTILDVAARAGVSKSLVSLVMRGSSRVSDRSRTAVLQAADELGYRPNAAAQTLVQQRSELIGVMVSDFRNPFFSEILEGIERAADDAGFRTVFTTGSRDAGREQDATETLLRLQTEALILAAPRYDDRVLRTLPTTVPTAVVAKTSRVPRVDTVSSDDARGAALVVDHLVQLGHRHIVHLPGDPGAGAAARLDGFVAAMTAHGLQPLSTPGGYTEDEGAASTAQVLAMRPRPTAVFAGNDAAAIGVMRALERDGLRIPEDISLAGYDNISIAGLDHISLTTVDQPRQQMGALAVELLLQRLRDGRRKRRQVVLAPTLVPRATTAPV